MRIAIWLLAVLLCELSGRIACAEDSPASYIPTPGETLSVCIDKGDVDGVRKYLSASGDPDARSDMDRGAM